ncbi:MAG: aminoacetone oxidase family FAD-binding enzyme [Victivallales bacterium]|nr:aminoacetone oxidase family FAD-binding enzyme [Victivallales bacterium]
MPCRLIIVGGGAAGLMASVTAGDLRLPALLVERRHRPGLKLLLCGNNRCNVSNDSDTREMLSEYCPEVGRFLSEAITAFPPDALRAWFRTHGLPTIVRGRRIYPASENSDDVLHCFLDNMRELQCPVILNCPVAEIAKENGLFTVKTEIGLSFEAENILLCTGGCSYPKTGSVGDGFRFAQALGHTVLEPKPGLAGMDIGDCFLSYGHESDIPDVAVTIDGTGIRTRGNLLCSGGILRGSAVFDSVSAISRSACDVTGVTIDFAPSMSLQQAAAIARNGNLSRLAIPPELAAPFSQFLKRLGSAEEQAAAIKSFRLPFQGIRPLKEAIVTVGGVSLDEINPETMESTIVPGLYFAGEVMDVDGPTGGFNLHAAFSTARLAVNSIARKCLPPRKDAPRRNSPPASASDNSPKNRYSDPRALSRSFDAPRRNPHGSSRKGRF